MLLVLAVGALEVLNAELKGFTAPQAPSGAILTVPIGPPAPAPAAGGLPEPSISVPAGFLSPADRFRLAIEVGFSPSEAVMALAVMLAENNPGDPNAVNHNKNGSDDIGIFQINDSHAAMAGGRQNLFDPVINARVALQLSRSGSGWLQWCTVPHGCGGGPGVPNFASLLSQAQAVAGGQ